MAIEGVDYAWSRPSPAGLWAAGKVFACRYVGQGSAGKRLTAAEAGALRAAGVAIVSNVEGTADGLLGGFSVGRTWAQTAHAEAVACGMPPSRPIYLSADFDVTATQWSSVRSALLGAADVLGIDRVGVYGSYNACAWARRDGVARWFWQTYAWSAGNWAPGVHIQQYRNNVSVAGTAGIDLDRAMTTDYGQWGGSAMAGSGITMSWGETLDAYFHRIEELWVPATAASVRGANNTDQILTNQTAMADRLLAIERRLDQLSAGGIDPSTVSGPVAAAVRAELAAGFRAAADAISSGA